jgi:serine/threonine protein kinase
MFRRAQVGDWIGERFEVFEIHEGGMGVVYLAKDRRATTGHDVLVLKTLKHELLFDPNRSARFASECHLWVHLGQHPNIVQAFAVEHLDGTPYIVLELVGGGELGALIGKPQLDPLRALRFGIDFCLGMEHAIRQGLRCHRDVKPGNLLVTASGALKITDFGLAGIRDEILGSCFEDPDMPIPLVEEFEPQQIVWSDPRDQRNPVPPQPPSSLAKRKSAGASAQAPRDSAARLSSLDSSGSSECSASNSPADDSSDPDATVDYVSNRHTPYGTVITNLTRTGVLMGTLPYMAPEQFRDAKTADVRSDIYSFGVVLFQMLTTELPFKGNTLAKLDRQHSQYVPPSVVPAIPRRYAREAKRIDEIVQQCLAKDPDERFATVGEFRRALSDSLQRLDHSFNPRRRA